MDEALLERLRQVDTPTVCNAIERVQGSRDFDRYTRITMISSAPDAPAIVGYARTARVSARRPEENAEALRNRRLEYYRYMAGGPRPGIVVIEDVDVPDVLGAWWGELNATIHRGFGFAGAVTNGVMRDLGDLPEGFVVIAGTVLPSHGFVHVLDVNTRVRVFGLDVSPGELIHADRHGAVVIPEGVIDGLADGIAGCLASERILLEPARREDFDLAAFEAAFANMERSRN